MALHEKQIQGMKLDLYCAQCTEVSMFTNENISIACSSIKIVQMQSTHTIKVMKKRALMKYWTSRPQELEETAYQTRSKACQRSIIKSSMLKFLKIRNRMKLLLLSKIWKARCPFHWLPSIYWRSASPQQGRLLWRSLRTGCTISFSTEPSGCDGETGSPLHH